MPKLRPKSVKRLLILAAAVAGVSVAGVGLVFTQQAMRAQRLDEAHRTGMRAYESGDYQAAITHLGDVVNSRPADIASLLALATSRVNVPLPGRRHLPEARDRFLQVLRLDPDNVAARRELLDIYTHLAAATDRLRVADDLLAEDTGDIPALRHRLDALSQLGRYVEALDAGQKILATVPLDVPTQMRVLELMRRLSRDPPSIYAQAKEQSARTDDPRLKLPLAAALSVVGRHEESLAMLRQAAAVRLDDSSYVTEVVAAFDRIRLRDEGTEVLSRAVDQHHDAALAATLVRRQWQAGRHAQTVAAAERAASLRSNDPGVLAMQIESLHAIKQSERAAALLQRLAEHGRADPAARAWAMALEATHHTPPLTVLERRARLELALEIDPTNGVVAFMLASALQELGESELALSLYSRAAAVLPDWPEPQIARGASLLQLGRYGDARLAADAAVRLAPLSAQANILQARCRFAVLPESTDGTESRALLETVARLRQHLPGDAELLRMHLLLLARAGELESARQVAGDYSRAPQRTVWGLDTIASLNEPLQLGLDLGSPPFATNTPLSALQAALRAARGSNDQTALDTFAALAGNRAREIDWRIADAILRQQLRTHDAAQAWRALGNDFPDQLAAQQAVLDSGGAALRGDREFVAATIERVRQLTGDGGIRWRTHRVRWLLESTSPADVREAVRLAMQVVGESPGPDTRLLLALALERTGDQLPAAIDHLIEARQQAPRDARIALNLARMLRSAGRTHDASEVLQSLARFEQSDPASRLAVAEALAAASMPAECVAMLQRGARAVALDPMAKTLLAEQHAVLGDLDSAGRLLDELTADASASPATLASAARIAGLRGNGEVAQQLLDRLRALPDTLGRELALARYQAAVGDVASARNHYAAVLELPEADESIWTQAVLLESASGDDAAAAELASRAAARFPGDPRLVALQTQTRVLADLTGRPVDVDQIIAALRNEPAFQVHIRVIQADREAQAKGESTPGQIEAWTALAEQFPASAPVQRRAVMLNLDAGDHDQAVRLARLAADRLPADPLAQQTAAQTLLAVGRSQAAMPYARRLRSLRPGLESDLILAESLLAQRDAPGALRLLEPHPWTGDVAPLRRLLAPALAQTKGVDAGFAVLQPTLPATPSDRFAWGVLLNLCPPDQLEQRLRLLEAATPDDPAEQLRLAMLRLAAADRLPDAEAVVRRALAAAAARASDEEPAWLLVLGDAQRRLNQPDAAEKTFRRLTQQHPRNAYGWNMLAYVLCREAATAAMLEESASAARRAIALQPNTAAFHDTLGRTEMARGRLDLAESAFREALGLEGTDLDALLGLAQLYHRRGQTEQAAATLAKVRSIAGRSGTPLLPTHLRESFRVLDDALSAASD